MPKLQRVKARTSPFAADEGVRAAYAAHGAELYRFALRGLQDSGAAQDAVQETFLRAWRSRERYDAEIAGVRAWLFAIARHVVIDHHRAREARPWSSTLIDTSRYEVEDTASSALDQLMRGWVVEEAFSRLGEDHRRALAETYLADRPYPEVAAELGIPESTLRSRVFYGLKALRLIMEEMEVEW